MALCEESGLIIGDLITCFRGNTCYSITMKITTKGQVTIPQHIRRYLGVAAYSEVDFQIINNVVTLVKADSSKDPEKSKSKFALLRGSKSDGLSTDEWMELTRGE